MDFVTIENDAMCVTLNLSGGAIHSIVDRRDGEELVWQGGSGCWKSHDHVLFPFVCRRVRKTYTVGGKTYKIGLHGFAPECRFAELDKTNYSVTLALYSTNETKKIYPYDFALYVKYELCGRRLKVRYDVVNPSDAPLYYSVGGHLGVALDGDADRYGNADVSGNYVSFDKPLTLRYTLEGNFIGGSERTNITRFEPTKEFFAENNTLMLDTDGGVSLTVERKSGKKIRFHVGSPVVAFWSDPKKGRYVCVEPWWGLPDELPKRSEISEKPFVIKLDGKTRNECGYELEI